MIRYTCGTTLALILLSLAATVHGQEEFLYTPTPASSQEKGQMKEGVLVREVLVKNGDTLSGISRRFSGRGNYYPQILLFNDIKNPNLIFTGDTLRVPVGKTSTKNSAAIGRKNISKKAAVESGVGGSGDSVRPSEQRVEELTLSDLRQPSEGKSRGRDKKKKTGRKSVSYTPIPSEPRAGVVSKPVVVTRENQPPVGTDMSSEQKLFERAIKAYRQGDCDKALELFDSFLTDYPASPLAADAGLYKGECYLKLSGQ